MVICNGKEGWGMFSNEFRDKRKYVCENLVIFIIFIKK